VDLTNPHVGIVAFRFDLDSLIGHVDDEAVEVGAQQVASHRVGSAVIEGSRVDEELHEAQNTVGRVLQSVDGELELLLDGGALHRSLLDACADLGHRKCSGCSEFDEAFFLGVELVELLL